VLGTSSSETVLPDMMRKLEGLGASKSVVGLVSPTGYVFNTDGTNIYLTLAALFLAQATNTHLSLGQIGGILLFALLASKGGSGVTGQALLRSQQSWRRALDTGAVPGAIGRHREIHERMPRVDKRGGKWRGHAGGKPVARRIGCGENAPGDGHTAGKL